MSVTDLAASLWHQRELMQELGRCLLCEQLLLQDSRLDVWSWMNERVGELIDEVALLELRRAAAADRVARELSLPPGATLSQLADTLQSPWGEIVAEHRRALLELACEVQAQAARNQHLLRQSIPSGAEPQELTLPEQHAAELFAGSAREVESVAAHGPGRARKLVGRIG